MATAPAPAAPNLAMAQQGATILGLSPAQQKLAGLPVGLQGAAQTPNVLSPTANAPAPKSPTQPSATTPGAAAPKVASPAAIIPAVPNIPAPGGATKQVSNINPGQASGAASGMNELAQSAQQTSQAQASAAAQNSAVSDQGTWIGNQYYAPGSASPSTPPAGLQAPTTPQVDPSLTGLSSDQVTGLAQSYEQKVTSGQENALTPAEIAAYHQTGPTDPQMQAILSATQQIYSAKAQYANSLTPAQQSQLDAMQSQMNALVTAQQDINRLNQGAEHFQLASSGYEQQNALDATQRMSAEMTKGEAAIASIVSTEQEKQNAFITASENQNFTQAEAALKDWQAAFAEKQSIIDNMSKAVNDYATQLRTQQFTAQQATNTLMQTTSADFLKAGGDPSVIADATKAATTGGLAGYFSTLGSSANNVFMQNQAADLASKIAAGKLADANAAKAYAETTGTKLDNQLKQITLNALNAPPANVPAAPSGLLSTSDINAAALKTPGMSIAAGLATGALKSTDPAVTKANPVAQESLALRLNPKYSDNLQPMVADYQATSKTGSTGYNLTRGNVAIGHSAQFLTDFNQLNNSNPQFVNKIFNDAKTQFGYTGPIGQNFVGIAVATEIAATLKGNRSPTTQEIKEILPAFSPNMSNEQAKSVIQDGINLLETRKMNLVDNFHDSTGLQDVPNATNQTTIDAVTSLAKNGIDVSNTYEAQVDPSLRVSTAIAQDQTGTLNTQYQSLKAQFPDATPEQIAEGLGLYQQ